MRIDPRVPLPAPDVQISLDLLIVAEISGTSTVMIEHHYGHLRGDVAAAALARSAL